MKWDTCLASLEVLLIGAAVSPLHLQDFWQKWISAAGFPGLELFAYVYHEDLRQAARVVILI